MFLNPGLQIQQAAAVQQAVAQRQRIIITNATFNQIQNGQYSLHGPGQGSTSEKIRVSPFQRPDRMMKNEPCKTYDPINLDDVIGKGRLDQQGYKVTKEHSFSKPCGGKDSCNFCALSEDLLDAANEHYKDAKNPVSKGKTRIFMSSIKSGHPPKVEIPMSRLDLNTKTKASSVRPEIWMQASIPQLDIFCSPNDTVAARALINSTSLGLPVDSEVCIATAYNWLIECRQQAGKEYGHRFCPEISQAASLPTRVIDVGPCDGSKMPFLLVTEGIEQGSSEPWVALSHCWGPSGTVSLITTEKTLHERVAGIQMETLPKSFQDAVTITRKLGFRYLWIDSLCILQDDKEDWKTESGKMNQVYSQAALVIAIEAAESSNDGIFDSTCVKRNQDLITVRYTAPSFGVADGTLWLKPRGGVEETSHLWLSSEGPLSSRAWTLQENFLAPRILKYGDSQIKWSCRSFQSTEKNANRRYDPDPAKALFQLGETLDSQIDKATEGLHCWYQAVNEFCRRDITQPADRLPAIAGLAKEVARRLPRKGFLELAREYHAGIWLSDLHRGLVWGARGRAVNSEMPLGPSWSWASVKLHYIKPGSGSMQARDMYDMRLHRSLNIHKAPYAKFVSIERPKDIGDVFLSTETGKLVLRGLMISYDSLLYSSLPVFRQHEYEPDENFAEERTFCEVDSHNSGLYTDASLKKQGIMYLHIAAFDVEIPRKRLARMALILKPDMRAGRYYNRIGIAEISHVDSMFEGWLERVVTII